MTITLLFTLTSWCVLFPAGWQMKILELEPIPFSFRVFIMLLAVGNLATSYVCEKYFFPYLAVWLSNTIKNMRSSSPSSLSQGGYAPLVKAHKKTYKRVMDEMGIVDIHH